MPSILNEEILQDVVKEIGKIADENERIETLTKFMLSGKQPLEATLNLVTRTCTIKFRKLFFEIKGKNWKFCGIPYNFGLLKLVLKTLLQNVSEVHIYDTPENGKDRSIIEKFITKKLRKFYTQVPIPAKFMIMLQECKLERIGIARFNDQEFDPMLLSDFFTIPAAIHELQNRFYSISKSFKTTETFDKVVQLEINQGGEEFTCPCIERDHKMLKLARIQRFLNFLINAFPNLKRVQMAFLTPCFSREYRFDMRQFIQPDLFKDISSRIEGKISFYTTNMPATLEGSGFILDVNTNLLIKTFKIHELVVEVAILTQPFVPI